MPLLFFPVSAAAAEAETRDQTHAVETVTCLYSEGAFDYELLCRLMVAHLQVELPGLYRWEVAERAGEGAVLSGSMDILDVISRGAHGPAEASFFGFVQSDVTYYFQNGGHRLYPTPHQHREEVVALARAYREVLHLYSEGLTSSGGLGSGLADWDEVYLGALGSGTLITALNLLSLYQLGQAELGTARLLQRHLTEGFKVVSPGVSWGGMLVAGTANPEIEARLASGAGSLLPLTPVQKRHLENAFSQLYSTAEIDGYGQTGLTVLEVPALLVASKRLPEDVAKSLVSLLNRLDDPVFDGRALYFRLLASFEEGLEEPVAPRLAGEVLAGIERYRNQRAEGLVLSPHRAILGLREDWGKWELAILLMAAALGFLVFRRLWGDLRKKGSILELSPLMTGAGAVAFSVGWIHLCLLVVSHLEYLCFMRYDTDVASPFISNSYAELLPKVMQYIASAFSSESLFPLDRTAQLMWLSIPVLIGMSGLAGLVHVALPPILNYIRTNLEEGTAMELENHFIIVNWHPHVQDVIGQLRVQEQMATGKDPRVVVLTRTAEEVTLPHLGKRKGKNVGEHRVYALPSRGSEDDDSILTVVGLEGDPQKSATLCMACPKKAEAVIVFPDPAHAEPDSATVLTVLRLQDILGESSSVRLLVWCADSANVQLFQDPRFRLTDACSTEWAWRVLCQATRVGHVSTIYRHLLTSSEDSNEFYEYSLPEGWNGTFAQAQEAIQGYNADPCDVAGSDRRNTILLVGYFEVSDARRERVQMNPAPESFLHPGDALVFLTYVYDRQVRERLDELFTVA